jgi:mono/diheme cytochrome c family protein
MEPAAAALAILREHCLRCHGPEKQRSSYRMDRHEALLKGGEIAEFKGTAAVIPGDPAGSLMIRFVEAEAEDPLQEIYPMPPPDDNPRLTREQIETLKTWIRQGARWEDR